MEKKEKDPELLEWLDSKYTKELLAMLKSEKEDAVRFVMSTITKDPFDISLGRAGAMQADLLIRAIEHMEERTV